MSAELIIRTRRAVTPQGVGPASIAIAGGVITALGGPAEGSAARTLDVGDAVVMAGLVDSHVHINEPGRTDWEGFATATHAAAAGGITTVCDMPLNCIPVTTTAAALAIKVAAAAESACIDLGFWGGVVPGNSAELEPLIDAGVVGFKCFLVHSGIDEFPDVGERDLDLAMPILARRGSVLLVHAELPGPIHAAEAAAGARDPRRYATWLGSRPRASEDQAVELMLRLSERWGCRVHIVHLSSADALPAIAAAKRRGVPVTVETCPHYLSFCAEDIPDGQTQYKCAPPIRERENRERLWQGLRDGTIDLVVSDHSPCTPALKALDSGDYVSAWGGIAGLGLSLSAVWTEARARGFTVADVSRWMSAGPARLARLAGKGALAVGRDADVVIWDPERARVIEPAHIRHRHPVTPFTGRELYGVVATTLLRGRVIYDHGDFPAGPLGRRLSPSEAPQG